MPCAAESPSGNSSHSACKQKPLSSDWLWDKSPSPLIGCGISRSQISTRLLLHRLNAQIVLHHIPQWRGRDLWFVVEGNRICDSWGRFEQLYLSICVCVLKEHTYFCEKWFHIHWTFIAQVDIQICTYSNVVHNFTLFDTGTQICFAPNIL